MTEPAGTDTPPTGDVSSGPAVGQTTAAGVVKRSMGDVTSPVQPVVVAPICHCVVLPATAVVVKLVAVVVVISDRGGAEPA